MKFDTGRVDTLQIGDLLICYEWEIVRVVLIQGSRVFSTERTVKVYRP